MHRTAQRYTDGNPESARQVAELRSKGWANERTWASNSRKVMAENDPAISGDVIAAVFKTFRGRLASGIQRENVGGDNLAVKPVRNHVRTDGGR